MRREGTGALLEALRAQRPLIHCMTNFVTANDCANLLLAAGASPMMAQDVQEAAQITALSRALLLNTGTPSAPKFDAMETAARAAARLSHPIILDPVGVGASHFRRERTAALLRAARPTVVRANLAEVEALLQVKAEEQGVDDPRDGGLSYRAACAAQLARVLGSVVLLTGARDVISDGARCLLVSGGSPKLKQVTGGGCMLSALTAAFCAVAPTPLEGAAAAAAFWKLCAARAARKTAQAAGGTGTLRMYLIDAAGLLTPEELEQEAELEDYQG